MKKGRRILLVFGGLALACLLVVFWPGEREPRSKGKKLSKWVLALDDPRPADEAPEPQAAAEAIRAMGTNAVPFLVKWVNYESSSYTANFYRLLAYFDSHQRNLRRLEGRTANSVTAFRCLGPIAEGAVPELNRIMTNSSSEEVSTRARDSLAFIGQPAMPYLIAAFTHPQWRNSPQLPGAFAFMGRQGADIRPAIPILVAYLKGTDEMMSQSCANALAELGRNRIERDTIVPALIEATHDPKPKVRREAVIALSNLGDASKPVIEALIGSMDDPEGEVAMYATRVLPRWQSCANVAVPALIKRLKPNDAVCIRTQMDALAGFGSKARPAVPALLQIMDKPVSPGVWVAASNAVWAIDREALRR